MAVQLTTRLESIALAGGLTPASRPRYRDAVTDWGDYLTTHGRAIAPSGPPAYLTPPRGNAKLFKASRAIWSLTLAPATASGVYNACPNYGACRLPCVLSDSAGRAQYDPRIMAARVLRTRYLGDHPRAALALITGELAVAARGRERIAVRLNAASDLRWELIAPDLLTTPWVDAYDYSKLPPDLRSPGGRYRIIYSIDERDTPESIAAKATAGPVAVVFPTPKHNPPASWGGYRVVDGDRDDYANACHPPGVVVGLALKGSRRARARAIASGFAQDIGGPRTTPRPRARLLTLSAVGAC